MSGGMLRCCSAAALTGLSARDPRPAGERRPGWGRGVSNLGAGGLGLAPASDRKAQQEEDQREQKGQADPDEQAGPQLGSFVTEPVRIKPFPGSPLSPACPPF